MDESKRQTKRNIGKQEVESRGHRLVTMLEKAWPCILGWCPESPRQQAGILLQTFERPTGTGNSN
jgi:hypothetical protein